MSRIAVWLLPLVSLLSLTAFGSDAAWRDCRAVADNAARLACYDALVDQLPKPAAADAVPVTPSAPAVAAQPAGQAVAPQPVAAAITPAVVTTQSPAEFGLERQAQQAQIESIQSRIVGPFRGWEAKSKITLENGQVWQIDDSSRGVYSLESPAVTIERGVFGSFFLKIDGVNRSPKVKRLK
ncbi:MAG TPA: hypothetical protein VFV64_01735 [Permianibacter sp.]|nr:hypothetical protein [Permianibacter sp.]